MSKIVAKATVGIYAEVINQIYDSMDKRLREAVSNSLDARAEEVRAVSVCESGIYANN